MDRNLALEMVRVTEAAAIASSRLVGRGDSHAADDAASRLMRKTLNQVNVDGTIVIGEGERDEAPMLYIGEKVGTGKGPEIDVAVDPLECTSATAKGRDNALSVLACAPAGSLLHAPDCYMHKLAVGAECAGKVDLDWPAQKNLDAIARALDKEIEDLTVIVMERERNNALIKEIRDAGARILLILDGDVTGAIATALPHTGVDALMGVGAAPEGVLAAAALKAFGGEIQGRLVFKKENELSRAREMGVGAKQEEFNEYFKVGYSDKLDIEDLAKGDNVMFAATGVTNGPTLKGVRFTSRGAITHSLVTRSKSGSVREIRTDHRFETDPIY
jgi:fructose-1,6-bisphosphatase II